MGNEFIIFTSVLLIIFYYIGFKFPDIDLKIKGLGHRSIMTHSFFLPLFIFYLHYNRYLLIIFMQKYYVGRFIIMGLAYGIAFHLLYDLRPKSFKGTALIKYPYMNKGLSVNGSITFMIISIMINLIITIYLAKRVYEIALLLILVILTLIFNKKSERGFYSVIITFLVLFSGVFLTKGIISNVINEIVSFLK